MKTITKLAIAATILAAAGLLVLWVAIGGSSTNMALADVAEALDSVRSATWDSTGVVKDGKSATTVTGKGFFLAPAHHRIELSVDRAGSSEAKADAEAARTNRPANSEPANAEDEAQDKLMAKAIALLPKRKTTCIMIGDTQAANVIELMPDMKMAFVFETKKDQEDMKKSAARPDLFEMVRRIVREGSRGVRGKVVPLGKKQINRNEAVGFLVRAPANDTGDMTVWADAHTARPIRIELAAEIGTIHTTLDNFRYNVDLDPSLFSLEPPPDYSTETTQETIPTEEDLLRTLRTVAEHNKGVFPAKLSINKEVVEAMAAAMTAETPEMDKATEEKLDAARKKIEAKYGGEEKFLEELDGQHGPEIMAELMKADMPIHQEETKKYMREYTARAAREPDGISFYTSLEPENDPHYVGGGVKLGAPDRPILWYKPVGAKKYRVVYADLSMKELTAEELTKLPEAKVK